jgi:hypothetical protein
MRRDLVGRVLGANYHRHGAGDGDGGDEHHAGGIERAIGAVFAVSTAVA